MTGLECVEFVELVSPYDDEGDELTVERLHLHRSECAGCERYARQLERTVRLISSGPWGPRATR
jgi:hypothetical protein